MDDSIDDASIGRAAPIGRAAEPASSPRKEFRISMRPRPKPARFQSLGVALVVGWVCASLVRAEERQEIPPSFWDSVFWTYTAGFDFSRGDYGLARNSTLFYMPLGVIADYDRFRVQAVVPFIVSDGPTSVLLDMAPMPLESETNSGVGEMLASASYVLDPFASGLPLVELGVQLTVPTRSKNELGTGGWGFATRIDCFREWGPVTPFTSFGRKFYTSDSLDDRFFASVGASVELTDLVAAGVSYDWLEETSGATPDAHEIVPFLVLAGSKRWSFGPYGVIGLSDASPDYGVGLSVSFAP